MFGSKIRIRPALYEKVKAAAKQLGCASPEEFVEKVLETEAEKVLASSGKSGVSEAEIEEISNKLKGLGYLD